MHGVVPVHWDEVSIGLAEERGGGSILRLQWAQCFPTFRARHAKINWIIGRGSEVDRMTFAEVDRERATGGTKATDAVSGGIGLKAGGDFSEAETGGFLNEFLRECAVALAEEIRSGRGGDHDKPPGIFG